MFRLKRAYEEASPADGTRILVDRFWPRGLSKTKARVDLWPRELAPSDELRKWYGHDRARYAGFRERYRLELLRQQDEIVSLAIEGERGAVTLLHAATDSEYSNAAVLKEVLEEALTGRRSGRVQSRITGQAAGTTGN
jgi:uncharacterized protein YeaO (DUF488 family)